MTAVAKKYQADRRRSDFTIVPNAVLRHTGIGGNAKALYAIVLLLDFTGDEPELDELGALLGGGTKTARSAVKELVDAGLLTSKRRGLGLTNAYIAHDPEPVQTRPEGTSGSADGARPSLKDVLEDDDVGAKAPTSGEVASTRARNLVFDALVEATHANPADGGMIAKAGKSIRTAMADHIADLTHAFMAANPAADEVPAKAIDEMLAAEIKKRARMYAELRPEWELTPTSLAKHWNRIPTWTAKRGEGLSASEIARLDLDG